MQQYQLTKQVKFTGVLSKKDWHQLSENDDIFINTTSVDNTPVSVMEAMALGLPVVSTNVGGLPYLIENEVDGLLINTNAVDEMVQQIERLLQNPSLVQNLTCMARKKVEQFDASIVKQQWNQLLKDV